MPSVVVTSQPAASKIEFGVAYTADTFTSAYTNSAAFWTDELIDYTAGAPAGLTLTRASSAWAPTSADVLESYASDVARRNDRGLLLSSATTQLLNHTDAASNTNAVPTQWVVTNATGLTATYTTRTENGRGVLRVRLNGTANGGNYTLLFGTYPYEPVTAAQTYTLSTQWGIVAEAASSFANAIICSIRMQFYAAPGNVARTQHTASLPTSGGLARQSITSTSGADAAYVRPGLQFAWSNLTSVDVTFDVALPNLTQSSAMLPEVVGGNVATAADVASQSIRAGKSADIITVTYRTLTGGSDLTATVARSALGTPGSESAAGAVVLSVGSADRAAMTPVIPDHAWIRSIRTEEA